VSEPRDDDELLDLLREELGERREPPPSGVAQVRAQAQARRDARPRPAAGRRRRDLLLGGAAASAGAALGVAGFALADDDPDEPPKEAIALTGAPAGVRARGELIDHTWGVELLLTVAGLQPGATYDVVYRAADGRDVPAGSFLAVEGEFLCRMTAALLRADTRAIEVRGPDGGAVLRSRLS
jgi:hypothetical protein